MQSSVSQIFKLKPAAGKEMTIQINRFRMFDLLESIKSRCPMSIDLDIGYAVLSFDMLHHEDIFHWPKTQADPPLTGPGRAG